MTELGKDKHGKFSSLPEIKSGPNRGYRHPEEDGEWICTGGYTYEARAGEKGAHGSWLKAMERLGIPTGRYELEGVVNLFVFQESDK